MKKLSTIGNIFKVILGIIFFAFVICMTVLLLNFNDYGVTQFGNTSLVIVKDELSNENYKKGDLVIVESHKIDKIKVGDELFAYKIDAKGKASIDLGIVGQIHTDENAITYENGETYSMDYVIGNSTKVHENIGMVLSIIESRWGFLFIVLVPSFLIFIYEIYALIVEIKYGDNEQ